MVNPEETAWVFDSLVGFLHGPVWNAPLQTFIEEKSLIFEPSDNGEIPHKEEYLAIHEEYKNLVDLMLGSYMEDIGITPDQFEAACEMSREGGGLPLHFHQRLFEQIWAANDYHIFTRMMTQKNVELQIQALELIEQRKGIVPEIFHQTTQGTSGDEIMEDDVIMEQVKKLSLEEVDSIEQNEIEELSAASQPEENNSDKQTSPIPMAIEEIHQEKENLKHALDNFQNRIVLKEIKKEERRGSEEIKVAIESHKPTPSSVPSMKPPKEDVEQRQKYLKQQRDKLLTLKKQIREKQLAENDGDSTLLRPKSSKTARKVLSGEQPSAAQDSSLQLRKVLADRLRSEVVDKS